MSMPTVRQSLADSVRQARESGQNLPLSVNQRVVIVCGMHRSGTSALAQMLAACGFHLGGPLLNDAVPDNPDGYWEHAEVVALHERLLACLDRTWHGRHGAAPLPAQWLLWPETIQAAQRIAAILQRELSVHDTWVVKDPRISRLLPLWKGVLEDLSLDGRVIHCTRHPAEVAASLEARQSMPLEQAHSLWTRHQSDLLATCPPGWHIPVLHEALMDDPAGTLRRLLDALGRSVSEDALQSAIQRLKPALRHHRATTPVPRGAVGSTAGTASDSIDVPHSEHGCVLIVMRTCNRPAFLQRAIRDILAQRYQSWRLWIVNDGGAAEPVDRVVAPYQAALQGRCTVRHLHENGGMEAASNVALREGGGRFIAIHDDDDRWHPDFLVRMTETLDATGQQGVVCATWTVHERSEATGIITLGEEPFEAGTESITLAALSAYNRFPPIAFLYRRDALERIGLYREDLPVLGDWEFNLRFARAFEIGCLPERLAYLHRRPEADAAPNSNLALHRRIDIRLRSELRLPWHLNHGTIDRPLFRAREVFGRFGELIPSRAHAQSLADPNDHFNFERVGDVWVALGPDARWVYSLAEKLVPGTLYIVHFRLGSLSAGSKPALSLSAERPGSGHDTIRLQHAPGGDYRVLIAPRQTLSHLRIAPLDRPGQVVPLGVRIQPVAAIALEALARPAAQGPRLPDFLCIGAQRSGTTWLHRNLAAHPRVWVPPAKEIHYFDEIHRGEAQIWRTLRRRHLATVLQSASAQTHALQWAFDFAAARSIDDAWYASLFTLAGGEVQAGDFTPAYAILPEAGVRHVQQIMPKAKILFLLRDPIERAISGAIHELVRVKGVVRPTRAAVLQELASAENQLRCDYRRTLATWERVFPATQIGIFFYDDIKHAPQDCLRRICQFLGLDPERARFSHLQDVHNANPNVLSAAEHRALAIQLSVSMMPLLTWLADRFGGHATRWLQRAQALVEAPDKTA